MNTSSNNLYPIPKDGFELHLTSADCTLFYSEPQLGLPKENLGMKVYDQWTVPKLTAKYLSLCDGNYTHGQIVQNLGIGIHPMLSEVYGEQILDALVNEMGVLETKERPTDSNMMVTGGFDSMAPLHISIEITDTCNFMCDHCYVSASPHKLGKRNGDDTLELLQKLKDNGIKVVELTGGECTTHPDFIRILHFAAENFHLVGIISNGYLIGTRKGLAKEIAKYDNVMIQISLDGMKEFHDRFRRKNGAFDMAVNAIKNLRKEGVVVRLAMTVTEENLDDIGPVFQLAKELDVTAFSCAPNSDFGRGQEISGCATKGDHYITKEISRVLQPHLDDPLFQAQKKELETFTASEQINCGAGWRSFGLNSYTGELRSCLFLADSKKFGTYDDEDYEEMFKSKEMQLFKDAPSPRIHLDTCKDCEHISTCNGCFAKAFQISESIYPECPWRAKYFGDMELSLNDTSKQKMCS